MSGWHSAPVMKCSCCPAVLAACMHLVTQHVLPTSCCYQLAVSI